MGVAICDCMALDLRSVEETIRLGRALGARLISGDYVALFGPIGAGKTTVVRGMTEGTGSPILATSPSFVLVHQYPGDPILLHADLYRLTDAREVEDLGIAEQAFELGAAIAVEWPERCPEGLPADRLEVHLGFANGGRTAEVRALGERANRLLGGLSLR